MSWVVFVLALLGLLLGLVAAGGVVLLFANIVRSLAEIERYAADILEYGVGITRNLDGVDHAVRTRELATAVPGLATRYLQKLGLA